MLRRSEVYVFALLGFIFADVKVRQQGRSPREICSMRTLAICTGWRYLQGLGALRRVVIANAFYATRNHVAVCSGVPECLEAERLFIIFFYEIFVPVNANAEKVV